MRYGYMVEYIKIFGRRYHIRFRVFTPLTTSFSPRSYLSKGEIVFRTNVPYISSIILTYTNIIQMSFKHHVHIFHTWFESLFLRNTFFFASSYSETFVPHSNHHIANILSKVNFFLDIPKKLKAQFAFHAWEFQENLLICFPLNPTLGNSTKVTSPAPYSPHIPYHPISHLVISKQQPCIFLKPSKKIRKRDIQFHKCVHFYILICSNILRRLNII